MVSETIGMDGWNNRRGDTTINKQRKSSSCKKKRWKIIGRDVGEKLLACGYNIGLDSFGNSTFYPIIWIFSINFPWQKKALISLASDMWITLWFVIQSLDFLKMTATNINTCHLNKERLIIPFTVDVKQHRYRRLVATRKANSLVFY